MGSNTANTVDNVSISSMEFIEDKYLLQAPDVTQSMEYDFVYDEEVSYTVTDTHHYYKNATFTTSNNLSIYTKTYLKADQILGMLGGVSFFIILLFRCFARRHNKYKMYIEIGDRLMVMQSNNSILTKDGKNIKKYTSFNISEWEVFKFSFLFFIYKWCRVLNP
jgi:hypothetical protein